MRRFSHTIEVRAESIYEAMAQALRIIRDNDWVDDIGHGQTRISVKVKHPEVEHSIRVQDFERWLAVSPRSPAEMSLKSRLRVLLAKE
jgi:hypothetical protein